MDCDSSCLSLFLQNLLAVAVVMIDSSENAIISCGGGGGARGQELRRIGGWRSTGDGRRKGRKQDSQSGGNREKRRKN